MATKIVSDSTLTDDVAAAMDFENTALGTPAAQGAWARCLVLLAATPCDADHAEALADSLQYLAGLLEEKR